MAFNMFRQDFWMKKKAEASYIATLPKERFTGNTCRAEWKKRTPETEALYKKLALERVAEFRDGKIKVSVTEQRRIYRKGKELIDDARQYCAKANIPLISMVFMAKAKTPLFITASIANMGANGRIRFAWIESLDKHLDMVAASDASSSQPSIEILQSSSRFKIEGWEDRPDKIDKLKTPPWNTDDIDYFESNWGRLKVSARKPHASQFAPAIEVRAQALHLSREFVTNDDDDANGGGEEDAGDDYDEDRDGEDNDC
ncbi:hypothetical protein BC829DRAFT_404240 [Chytridium lagenaria]|nr:hypothetical protein BC829DRAFT_404240 [Chytridium lagenaria]